MDLLDFDDPDGHRVWIVPVFAHPVGTAMLHDETRGVVTPKGELGLSIDCRPTPADLAELGVGLWGVTKLLFAAGARHVHVPGQHMRRLSPGADLTGLKVAAVSSRGKHHHLEGLWIADGSLFPTSIGVPPQLSIYALGLHVGRAIVGARG